MTITRSSAVIAIHGGAGTMSRHAGPEHEAAYRDALEAILRASQALLADGAGALDAVVLAVRMLEDCPFFNAGHGAVFTSAETHELDAAVMDGSDLRAGAVACVSRLRHPIDAARAVMEQGQHVLLVGAGAEAFARDAGLEMVAPDYFSTDARREQLILARERGGSVLDHDSDPGRNGDRNGGRDSGRDHDGGALDESRKLGTVGAVACDIDGNLAAATSTGGMTNKRPGRVGDSPLIGAGTYADNRTAAVSCTGTGEMFIRVAAAYELCARMAHAGATLDEAARAVVSDVLPTIGGRGGLIAVDARGNVSLPFNTEGMYRGHARVGEPVWSAVF